MFLSKKYTFFLVVFSLALSITCSLPAPAAPHKSKTTKVDNSIPLEENPDYVPYEDSDSDSDEYDTDNDSDINSDDEYDDDSDVEDHDDLKSMVNRALAKSNQLPSKTLRFIKKNRNELTIACALFAFRREIWHFAVAAMTIPNKDGSRSVRVRITPTAILKIALFIDVMRKMQSGGPGGEDGENNMYHPGRMGLMGLVTDLMKPANSAFVPPVVQHYTFEKMNDRYLKDGNAFRKVMGMEMPRPAAAAANTAASKPFMGRVGIIAGAGVGGEASQSYNSTIIVMDMKGLDSGLSSMESIRDQVSFLLDQHTILRKEAMLSMNATQTQSSNTAEPLSNASSASKSSTKSSTTVTVTVTNTTTEEAIHQIKSTPEAETHINNNMDMEIIILLESPGGSASDYGLAAQQIARLRDEPGITVTICVDKVAASGGYMMACMSSPGSLIAAPFAIVGSIGVIGQTINIHKSLQNFGVQPLVFRGGKDKAPVGLVGEVTKEGLAKVQDMVDKTHQAFKRHVANARPHMAEDIDEVATGDVWLACDALEIGMVDAIMTSDEYIRKKMMNGDRVLKLIKCQRLRFGLFGMPHPQFPGVSSVSGSVGVFQQTFRSISDTIHEFGSILKKANALLEDQLPGDISQVACARAMGVASVSSALGKR